MLCTNQNGYGCNLAGHIPNANYGISVLTWIYYNIERYSYFVKQGVPKHIRPGTLFIQIALLYIFTFLDSREHSYHIS